MGSIIRNRGYLALQFYWERKRHREHLGLSDTRDNRREAERRLKEVEREIRLGTFDYAKCFPDSRTAREQQAVKQAMMPLTLGQHARLWLKHQPLTPRVVQDYEYLFRVFLDRTELGAMLPALVTRHHIREAIEGHSKRRTTMFLQRLRTIFEELVEDGHAKGNPAQSVRNPKRGPRPPVEGLSVDEQAALLKAATGQDRNLIALGLATGLRPAEILSIERKDIDWERQRLTVRGTKTMRSARVISLEPEAVAALRSQLQLNRRLHAPVFGNTRGKKLNYTNWRGRNWNAIVKRAGLTRHLTPYAMRHDFAIAMLARGVDPTMVAKLMGHTSPETIFRHYARWTLETAAIRN